MFKHLIMYNRTEALQVVQVEESGEIKVNNYAQSSFIATIILSMYLYYK